MVESNLTNQEKNECGLIEMFVILLKYRYFVLASLIISALIIIVGYFIYPSWKYNNTNPVESGKAVCKVIPGPTVNAIGFTPSELIGFLKSNAVFYNALQESGYSSIAGIDIDDNNRSTLFNWLENSRILEISNEYPSQLKSSNIVQTPVIKITFKNSDKDKSILFLNKYVTLLNKQIFNVLKANLQDIVNGKEMYISEATIDSKQKETTMEDYRRYAMAKRALDNESALILYVKPYSLTDYSKTSLEQITQRYIKMALVFFITVVLIVIFITLLLQYVDDMKNDKNVMDKIRKAMGRNAE